MWVAGLLVAVVVAVVAGVVLWWLRVRRRRVGRKPVVVRHPVVLAHGLFGFDELRLGRVRREYFMGVPQRLRTGGADVHVLRVHPFAGVEARADELARYVASLDTPRVNIIAHSMGGLDARYAISQLGLAPRVASLITVGTPHHGTPIADVAHHLVSAAPGLRLAMGAMGLRMDALRDLTTGALEKFNQAVPNHKDVVYGSFIAAFARTSRSMHPLLLPTYLFLAQRYGANDGLVPASSQEWGEVLGTVEADHWAQIGWSGGFDAPAFYQTLAEALKGRGL